MIGMALQEPFSKSNRLSSAKEITIRYFVLDTARQLEYAPCSLRTILCRALRVGPDPGNWSEFPNIWGEVQELMYGCEWFKVYDIIEALHASFARNDENNGQQDATVFADAVNGLFVDEGIGWQLVNGQIVTRGPEGFETVIKDTTAASKHPPGLRLHNICMKRWKTSPAVHWRICRALSITPWERWSAWRAILPVTRRQRASLPPSHTL